MTERGKPPSVRSGARAAARREAPSRDAVSRDRSIVILAIPGCMTSAVVGCLEAFGLASALQLGRGPLLDARAVTVSGEPVAGFGGIEIRPTAAPEAIEAADIVIVPPMLGDPRSLAENHPEVVRRVREASEGGSVAAAACTGTFLLAETGLLNGRRATTTPAFRDLFERCYPEVHVLPAMRVVDEGAVVTAGATTSYLDLALSFVARVLGPRIALQTARLLATDPNPRSQRPYLLPRPALEHPDDEVRKAEQWIAGHLADTADTASLARTAGLGERTFLRRFKLATGESPREYIQRQRVEAAMKDLEATNRSFEEITYALGYEDVRSFRRLFHRLTGLSPREHRARFGYGADDA